MNHAPNISNAALRKAALLVRDAMLASLPEPDQCEHTFSPSFYAKMNALLARERAFRQRHRFVRRVAIVLLSLVLGSGIWLTVDTDARAAVVSWVREVYENSFVYRFFHDETVVLPSYRLDVSNDYELKQEVINDSIYSVYYENSYSGQWIIFEYCSADNGDLIEYIGNQNSSECEEVKVGNISAFFYQSVEDNGTNNLIWIDEQAMIEFTLDSNLLKDDMIALAENLITPTEKIE